MTNYVIDEGWFITDEKALENFRSIKQTPGISFDMLLDGVYSFPVYIYKYTHSSEWSFQPLNEAGTHVGFGYVFTQCNLWEI